MKLILLATLLLAGCSTTVPVKMQNPFDIPPSLMQDCRDPEMLNPEAKFSENVKIMIDNNTKATECRVAKRALNELIQQRKDIFDKSVK